MSLTALASNDACLPNLPPRLPLPLRVPLFQATADESGHDEARQPSRSRFGPGAPMTRYHRL